MGLELKRCPECEGTGKAVNYFDFPKDPFRKNSFIIDTKERRSDGREYYDHECEICKGTGVVVGFK
jgi:RecJ-like exonuclease